MAVVRMAYGTSKAQGSASGAGAVPQMETAQNVQDTGSTGKIEFRLDANGKGEYRAVGASDWIPFLSGGSGPTYTRLWTNGSPTSNFSGQTVTLSQAANTFDAVRIVWAYNTSSGATGDDWEGNTGAMPQWYQFGSAELNHASGGYLLIGVVFTQTNSYARRGYFTSDYTGLFVSNCQRLGASGNSNGNCIPLCVEGVTF